jgi:hypothetical protein
MSYTRIVNRRGLASEWSSVNPILASGEIGFEADTTKFKIGNGASNWGALPYYETSSSIYTLITNQIIDSAPSSLDTLNELAAALNDDSNFASTVIGLLDDKADIDSPSFTGTVDFSAATVSGVILPINWLGTYDNAESYAENDLVESEGSTYYATGPNLNYASGYAPAQPGSDWELFAAGAVAATIEVGDVTSGAPTDPPLVTNVGTDIAAVFDFTIPSGVQGIQGEAATIAVGSVSASDAGTQPTITNSGTNGDATFDFVIPQGLAGSATAGTTTTVPVGTPASVTNSGDTTNAVFDFTIPVGIQGEAATVEVGSVATVPSSDPATVANSGTTGDAVFDFEIPQGAAATIEVGTIVTVTSGTPADVTNSGTPEDAVFDFTLPAGIQGVQGVAATIAVGTVETVTSADPATISNSGTTGDAVFDFEIPQGLAASLSVGTVTTVTTGNSATVVNSGTAEEAVFDFTIPAGLTGIQGPIGETGATGITWQGPWEASADYVNNDAVFYEAASWFASGDPVVGEIPDNASAHWYPLALQGAQGIQGEAATISVGTVTTGAPQDSVVVTNVGTTGSAVFDFVIPKGDTGSIGALQATSPIDYDSVSSTISLDYDSLVVDGGTSDVPQSSINLRRSTAAEWLSENPVLGLGEAAFESDTNKLKIGDGIDTWDLLSYASGGASVEVGDAPPSEVEPNTLWWNSDEGVLYIYYDNFWVEAVSVMVGPTGAQGKFLVSETAPNSPEPGDGWFNSTNARFFIYYDSYWVEAATNFKGATGSQGIQGKPGVVSADLPLSYDPGTRNISIDLSSYDTSTEVDNKISGLIDAAPGTLDTLNELAAALGDDENFSTTVATSIGQKKTEVVSSIGVNTSCVAGYRYITTVASGITLTLPASPSAGDEVQVLDGTGAATSILVARNGNLINGLSEDADLDVAGFAVVFIYTSATFGWRLG